MNWVVGTDCAASNDGWSVSRELRYVAGMRARSVSSSPQHQAYLKSGALSDARHAWATRSAARNDTAALADDSFVLSRAWSAPGTLHPEFRTGELSVGSRADFAVWDLNHPCFWPDKNVLRALVWGRTDGALKRLMQRGTWWSDAQSLSQSVLHSDMWRDCRKEASDRLESLLQRAGF